MSTIEADPETDHDDHGHDHPSFLAHHFDTPEQQFDSGKLGIWLFLVTEILFFSGMFCAYAIFRMLNPDVFEGCSQFLNTKLGAINTGVLLFSSLTMALAVRCAQTENHKGLTAMLSATLSCAMIFLGVKAIEYSHKWGMGLLPPKWYFYTEANPHPPGQPNYLAYLCAPFAIALIGVVIWLLVSIVKGNKFHTAIAKPLSVVCLSFFLGVGLGAILESGGSDSHADAGHAEHAGHDADDHVAAVEVVSEPVGLDEESVLERLATEQTNSGLISELAARERQADLAGSAIVAEYDPEKGAISTIEQNVMTKRRAGVFFSIYYCMTGVHAIHILGGIAVLIWLLVRSIRKDFNRHYFGPVDYVGLYWHLVDLIWIYLFPLLYLIR
jgi:cytochrome c oxidase subunit 3